MRLQVRSLALLSGLRIRRSCELCCRSQTRLGSHTPEAVVAAATPIGPLAWELPYAAGAALKRPKKRKRKKRKKDSTLLFMWIKHVHSSG